MAWDLGDALDLLRGVSDLPDMSSGAQGPARRRVGRWTGRGMMAIMLVTGLATAAVWLRSPDFAAFDQNALPVVTLGLVALVGVVIVHCVAAIVANRIDRRAAKR